MIDYREVRSVLCVPGHDAKKIERCREFGADLILFDLEDSVPEDKKHLARILVSSEAGPQDAVRIGTNKEDIWAADRAGSTWVPKYDPDADEFNLWRGSAQVVFILESPAVIFDHYKLGHVRNDAAGIAFGAMDFLARTSPTATSLLEHARAKVAMAAAARGIPASDAPCLNLGFSETYLETREAIALGYSSKGCVNREQVMAVNEAFEDARPADLHAVVEAADASSESVISFAGRVYGPALIQRYREMLNGNSGSD